MTEQVEETEAAEVPPELPIQFQGREIWVRMPRPEQILVWQRTLTTLQGAPITASWTGSEVMTALERLRKIVDSLMVNKADVAWLDDQFLDGELGFKDLTPFVTKAIDAFKEAAAKAAPNRAARRTAAPKKKATRKKANS